MKNINYVINGVIAVAVIILFVMQFSSKKESTVAPAFTTEGDSTNLLPVAYVNVDSLLSNYNYSKDLNERILKMQEDYRLDMTQRSNALRTELNDFQRKYEANAFLTTERAQQEGNRLQKKQEELQNYAAKKEQELAAKQMELNGQLRDTIVAQLTTFNQTKGYQIQYSTDSKFKSGNKTVTVNKNSTTKKTISKLKAKKKYYVRIRTYKTVGKQKYYSDWSKSVKVTTKK